MYWLGFGHGVIAAFFVFFVVIALTGTLCVRMVARLAAANRERARAMAAPLQQRPPAPAAAAAPNMKG